LSLQPRSTELGRALFSKLVGAGDDSSSTSMGPLFKLPVTITQPWLNHTQGTYHKQRNLTAVKAC
jgi:hypothetical protein